MAREIPRCAYLRAIPERYGAEVNPFCGVRNLRSRKAGEEGVVRLNPRKAPVSNNTFAPDRAGKGQCTVKLRKFLNGHWGEGIGLPVHLALERRCGEPTRASLRDAPIPPRRWVCGHGFQYRPPRSH